MAEPGARGEPARVLAISTSYPLRGGSVSGIFVHNLYKALPKSWSVEVLCPDDDIDSGGLIDGIRVTPVRYFPKRLQVIGGSGGIIPSIQASPIKLLLLPFMLLSIAVYTAVKARSVNVVHANWAICGLIAALACKFQSKKIVLTLRGSDVGNAKSSKLFRWQLKAALRGADYVVCVSKAMAEELCADYPHFVGKVGYCNNGVSDAFFGVTNQFRDANTALTVLAIGGLVPVKGFDVLIKAFALLPADASIKLNIVGEGPERQHLQSLIDGYGLTKKISLKGELAYGDIPGIMGTSHLFVLSSLSEGRPNVVAEAVASGLSVISSDLPGVKDLVMDGVNGWTYSPGDSTALAALMQNALANRQLLAEMGGNGRRMIQDGSSWGAAAAYYDALFNRLLNGRKT